MLASGLGSFRDVRSVPLMLRRATLLLTLAGGLLVPSLAHASGAAVIHDCEANGQLTRHYSESDLNSALHSMPADLKEYSNCVEAVQQAQAAGAPRRPAPHHNPNGTDPSSAAGGGPGAPGGPPRASTAGGASPVPPAKPVSPADAKALGRAQAGGALGNRVAAAAVRPGAAASGSGASLPAPLIAVLVLLAAGALASLVGAARRRRPRWPPGRLGRALPRGRT